MIDETGEMRATGFNQDADRLGALFEIGKCYQIRGGRIKPANRRFSHLNNDYELTFGHETEAVEIEDSGSVAKQKFDYVDFARFEAMDKENAFVDVLAVITDIQELSSIVTKKDQRELKKRELELMDKSNIAVRCTLWGKDAMNFNHPAGSIISIKAASLRDFQGASLSAGMSAVIEVNPDSEEAHDLRVWYDTEGKTSAPIRIARTGGGGGGGGDRRIMLSQIKDENMGMSPDGKADYFLTKATITFVRKSENMMYKACASADCNKKVIEENDSEYRCEKCNRTMDNFKWRIIPGFSVCDPTGQTWVSAFSEVAEKIFGHATQEMGETRETNPEQFEKIIEGAFFKTVMMKCRAKAEVYNDESRVKVTLNEVWPVDPVVESKYLIEQIKAY
jgi:replication factor A1